MEGAVDAGVEVVETLEEGQLPDRSADVQNTDWRWQAHRLRHQGWNSTPGDRNVEGGAARSGAPQPWNIEREIRRGGSESRFRHSTIRDFIDDGIAAGQLKYEKRKLYVKAKAAVEVTATYCMRHLPRRHRWDEIPWICCIGMHRLEMAYGTCAISAPAEKAGNRHTSAVCEGGTRPLLAEDATGGATAEFRVCVFA